MTERDTPTGGTHGGRVLALVDASRPSLAALKAAARLAARRKVELVALFVEDIALVRSAGYAFCREVGAVSGNVRQLDVVAVETRLRRQGERARRALAEAAASLGIAHSLSIRRGHVVDEIHAVAQPGDLLVLARAGWSAPAGRWLGSTARALVEMSPVPVMLHDEHAPRRDGPVVALVDDGESARETIAFAADLALQETRRLAVLLTPNADARAAHWQELGIESHGINNLGDISQLQSNHPQAIARALHAERAVELVVSRRCRALRERGAGELLDLLDLPATILP